MVLKLLELEYPLDDSVTSSMIPCDQTPEGKIKSKLDRGFCPRQTEASRQNAST